MRSVCRRFPCLGAGAALSLFGRYAGAEPLAVDSSYGRVDGDVAVAVGLGVAIAPRGPRAAADLRLRYLESVGAFATYEEGGALGSASEPPRVFGAGLELRPLFLFRWLEGHEAEHPRFDLALDSIGLELGAIFQQPSGAGADWRRGLQVGLGIELPLRESASGPWIGAHAFLRWSDDALATAAVRDADDRQAVLMVTLAWHQLVAAHVVDLGDEAPR